MTEVNKALFNKENYSAIEVQIYIIRVKIITGTWSI